MRKLTPAQVELLSRLEIAPVSRGGTCGWALQKKGLALWNVPEQRFEITAAGRRAFNEDRIERAREAGSLPEGFGDVDRLREGIEKAIGYLDDGRVMSAVVSLQITVARFNGKMRPDTTVPADPAPAE